jgi:hypothetical protein
METQNITLALPKELLHKIKLIAVQHRTSVSGLLTGLLTELATKSDEYEKARRRQLSLMENGFNMGWSQRAHGRREDLHERR